jgi:small subunit ribosomal protein S6
MMYREYETVVILHPNTLEDGVHRFNHRVKEVLERQGGLLLKVETWGKRKLAYEIQKETKGIYLYFQYLGNAGLVEEFERMLRLSDICMRYQTVKLADKVDSAERSVDESAKVDFLAAAEAAAKALAEAAARGEEPPAAPEVEELALGDLAEGEEKSEEETEEVHGESGPAV